MRFWAAAVFVLLGAPVSAQVLDPARATGDGCELPAPPPYSKPVTAQNGPVVEARYAGATSDYAHGVLGDAIEGRTIMVRYDDGTHQFCDAIDAGPGRVFEDTSPRLADLNGDGLSEVIAVASSATQGARLEIYGYPGPGKAFQLLAHTPYIGTRNRWLAPMGAADLDGDGVMEIAYIDRPHLAKTLRVWRYENQSLTEIAVQPGFSNHKIGWPFIAGGIRDCGPGPEMILSTGNWARLMAVQLKNGQLEARDLGAYTGPDSLNSALNCS
ncbi:MAG: VCBS repeat-containing protein [Pseudomonadota bacterium]